MQVDCLVWHRKSIGPITVPCGTPESTGTSLEDSPSNTTLIERSIKKFSSLLSVVPAMLQCDSLWC